MLTQTCENALATLASFPPSDPPVGRPMPVDFCRAARCHPAPGTFPLSPANAAAVLRESFSFAKVRSGKRRDHSERKPGGQAQVKGDRPRKLLPRARCATPQLPRVRCATLGCGVVPLQGTLEVRPVSLCRLVRLY